MPSKKPSGKKLPSSRVRSPGKRRAKPKGIYASFVDPSVGTSGAVPSAWPPESRATKRFRFRRGERQKFKSFQKKAKRVGLLVSKDSYELYFRDHDAKTS